MWKSRRRVDLIGRRYDCEVGVCFSSLSCLVQTFKVEVGGSSSSSSKKTWEDFEVWQLETARWTAFSSASIFLKQVLYDSLELRYSDAMKSIPFPRYATRCYFLFFEEASIVPVESTVFRWEPWHWRKAPIWNFLVSERTWPKARQSRRIGAAWKLFCRVCSATLRYFVSYRV